MYYLHTYIYNANRCVLVLLIFFFCHFFSLAQTGSELVNIHSVTDVNAMNNISSPVDGNLVFVVSENCIFQYNGTSWSKYWKSDGNIANNNDFI